MSTCTRNRTVSDPDSTSFRNALAHFGTGVTVVTARDEDGSLYGVTVSSFNAVSLEPRMVLWSQALKAPSNPVFQKVPLFAINVLDASQQELATHFARPSCDKFAGVDYRLSEEGLPILEGTAAYFICSNDHQAYGGDHTVFISTVIRFAHREAAQPLFFWKGQFLQPLAAMPSVSKNQ